MAAVDEEEGEVKAGRKRSRRGKEEDHSNRFQLPCPPGVPGTGLRA